MLEYQAILWEDNQQKRFLKKAFVVLYLLANCGECHSRYKI
jgi:hypothetical protein